VAYIVVFATIDGILEAHLETAHQMLIRLVVVAIALVVAVVFVLSVVHRSEQQARILAEEARLAREQAEREVLTAHQEGRVQGTMLTIREFAPWLGMEASSAAAAASSARASEPVPAGGSASDGQVGMLTPREREVAVLIALGRTSREIAEDLVITERTADTHADRIRAKLGLRSRAEIVAWALGQGLVRSRPFVR
jgi:DNA-binding CsgD family transcriptional regulator